MQNAHYIQGLLILFCCVLFCAVSPAVLEANEIVVDATEANDVNPGTTTLNEAITEAINDTEDNLITFSEDLSNTTLKLDNFSWNESAGSSLHIDGANAPGVNFEITSNLGGSALSASNSSLQLSNLIISLEDDFLASSTNTFIEINNGDLLLNNVSLNGFNPTNIDRPRIGINANNSNVELVDSIITRMHSEADTGSAINFIASGENYNLTLDNSVIQNNGIRGASSLQSTVKIVSAESSIQLQNCSFIGNNSFSETAGLLIQAEDTVALEINIENCRFINNATFSDSQGHGAVFLDITDSIYTGTLSLTMKDNVFSGNQAFNSSHLYLEAEGLASVVSEINNSSFSNGSSQEKGLYLEDTDNDAFELTMIHNTIAHNSFIDDDIAQAAESGLSLKTDSASNSMTIAIFNTLVFGNKQSIWNGSSYDIINADLVLDGMLDVDLASSLFGAINIDNHTGNLQKTLVLENQDPLFESIELPIEQAPELNNNNLCLQENSPARDAADETVTRNNNLDLDLSGNSRLFDIDPDMGALEYQSCIAEIPGDIESVEPIITNKVTKGGQLSSPVLYVLALYALFAFRLQLRQTPFTHIEK